MNILDVLKLADQLDGGVGIIVGVLVFMAFRQLKKLNDKSAKREGWSKKQAESLEKIEDSMTAMHTDITVILDRGGRAFGVGDD